MRPYRYPSPAGAVTSAPDQRRANMTGILCALGGSALLSVNDMAVKFLSGGYPLHEVILIRATIGMTALLVIVRVMTGSLATLRTRRPLGHLLRVVFVLLSNVTFFLGIAALPLADAVAIFFVCPLLLTALSVPLLGERVGPRRWAAVAVGLIGVVVMTRPGAGVIQPAALLVLAAALAYALMTIMTRRMGGTESAFAFGFYVQAGFIFVSLAMGLVAGDGRFAPEGDDPVMDFLLRAWVWPDPRDLPYFLATGLAVTVGGMLVTQAYRLCEAGLIAPFEYASMPMAIFWGVVVFGQWPDRTAWTGIALICGAGLYALWRETKRRRDAAGGGAGA